VSRPWFKGRLDTDHRHTVAAHVARGQRKTLGAGRHRVEAGGLAQLRRQCRGIRTVLRICGFSL